MNESHVHDRDVMVLIRRAERDLVGLAEFARHFGAKSGDNWAQTLPQQLVLAEREAVRLLVLLNP